MNGKNSLFTSPSQKKGQHYEELALKYLQRQGLRLLEKNFNSRCGELDLVLMDRRTVVFVEVRFRNEKKHGNALDTINYFKQKKIIKAAKLFLLKHGLSNEAPCRFDVIGITLINDKLKYQWIKSAFY